jgi:pectate lyase
MTNKETGMDGQMIGIDVARVPCKAGMGALAVALLLQGCGGGNAMEGARSISLAAEVRSVQAAATPATPATPNGPGNAATPATPAMPVMPIQSTEVTGWASQGAGTTGGAGAPDSNIYVVHNWAELNAALANHNSPTYALDPTAAKSEPKIIYVVGTLYGTDLGNGKLADEAYYKTLNATAAKWDWNLYLLSLDTAYMADLNARVKAGDAAAIAQRAKISALSSASSTLRRYQKAQIQAIIPSNTTILGVGTDAKLIDGYFSINATKNIVIRNLEFQAPQDLTANWNGKEWNSSYKAISVVTGKQLWIDHCTLSDGAHFDSAEVVTINGVKSEVQRHDGLIDIEDSSDFVTISYTIFKNHDKTNMVGGSGDQNGVKERDYNHLTFSNDIWDASTQRAPRARFGRIHVYNNYYKGDTAAADYRLSYFLGMGAESKILSEGNVFEITGPNANASKVVANLNGYQFKDVGSWINGQPASADIEAAAKAALDANWSKVVAAASASNFTVGQYTNELGWTPTYPYQRAMSPEALKRHNLAYSGAGRLGVDLAQLGRGKPPR